MKTLDPPALPKEPWSLPLPELFAALGSGPDGLTEEEAGRRRAAFGPNALQSRKRAGPLGLFLRQVTSPIVLILLVASGLSAALGNWTDFAIISAIVVGSALLSFAQEWRANTAAEALNARLTTRTQVVRGGAPRSVPAEEVVPGDVVLLSAGSLVPADAVVIEARDFFVNQSVLTGESFPAEKKPGTSPAGSGIAERTNMIFLGTNARSGTARALVVRSGASTEVARIAARLSGRPPETEFEGGVRRLGLLLSGATLVLVLFVLAVNVGFQRPFLDSVLFSLALAVGLTPQLLPAVISINLSRGARAMAKSGVLVRRLASLEDFGSMDVLCTDKTGTLTEGIVRLDGAFGADGEASPEVLRLAASNARLQTGLVNPLDEAITAAVPAGGAAEEKLDEIPYDFARKRMSVVVKDGEGALMVTKGALDGVATACARVRGRGEESPFGAKAREAVSARFVAWSEQGYRVLGVSTRRLPIRPAYGVEDEAEMTFEGFLLFFDPPRASARAAIEDLARLHVSLKVITGDNRLAALHTTKTLGLQSAGVLTGAELKGLGDEALAAAVEKTLLFAEVDPDQKERIIAALRRAGHVVGYMGDGINDAPALHAADVGISVESAVDVAKEAADVVLLEKDLGVLHQGIVLGRTTFANTLKYVFMASSANFGNMFSMAAASLALPFLPMLPKQLLVINFLTDLPEMAISSDRVDSAFVSRPRRWNVRYIRRFMLVFGPLSSVFDLLTFAALIWLLRADPARFRTAWFVESILSASIVVFSLRTHAPFYRSRPSRIMVVATILVGLATVALPYTPLAAPLGFAPLPPLWLATIGGIVAAYFGCVEVAKRIFHRRHPL